MHPYRYRIFIGSSLSTAICEAFGGFTIASDGAYPSLSNSCETRDVEILLR